MSLLRPLSFAALMIIAVTLAGCASASTPGGPASAGPPTSIPPSGGSTAGPPPLQDPTVRVSEPVNTVTPSSTAEKLVAAHWTRAEPVPGEAAVQIFGTLTGGPPCAVLGPVQVRETATDVTITVQVGQQRGADCGGVQTQVAFPYVTKVLLREPVGERTVRDGA